MELEDKITDFFFFSKLGVTSFRFQELYRENYREKY
jgi:heme oxygenase